MKGLLGELRPESGAGFNWRDAAFVAAQVATLALLLLHAREYRFLTDDAYISFRYARNLTEGAGLVFNPGLPPVEGYTNFLWVLLLAGLSSLGVGLESLATVLSMAATVALWGLVAEWASRNAPKGGRRWLAVVPPLLLASTRSVAVWSTSGLETRVFEVLVVAGALRLLHEVRQVARRRPAPWPASAVLFALAALTRPDAILLYGCAAAAAAANLALHGRLDLRRFARGPAVFAAVVGTHFLWRRLYYGAWLPNTFHAKVTGFRWDTGWMHHAAFGLEYAVWLWVPLIALGVRHHLRNGTGRVPAVFGAIVLPHLIYVAAVGGDHFEYRPQDLYFPFAYLLVYAGLLEIAAMRRGMAAAAVSAALVLGGVVALPRDAHVQFPRTYHAGFPGWATALPEGRVYLHPDRDPVMHLPGLRILAAAHRDLLRKITHAFVGVRQEEHRLFLEEIRPEAEQLRKLVHDGVIPEDACFAMDSVGLIPFVTDLRVLDRLGLNDAHVARTGEVSGERLLAHERRASLEYGREQGVDFWPLDAVHSLFRADDPALLRWIDMAVEHRLAVFVADAQDGWRLLGLLPQGEDSARERFPRLRFVPVADPAARELLAPAPDDAASRGAG